MGQIRLLSDVLASQVAAGEVVERPASVVKELVENSIDAGARRITMEFQRGGTRLIRVTDDGRGMDRSDALLSLERHATSKIRESADLATISTLGFRGEALPSIASVSRFSLVTRQKGDEVGTAVEVSGGKILGVTDSGEAPGTRIEVADLFFNVPARRKFLRGEQTEAAHLLQQIEILAVAHPEIAFTCRRDDREIFRLAATEDLAVRLRDLHGVGFLEKLVPVPPLEDRGVSVHGWIARPGEGRSDRNLQLFFVNGRMIRSPILSLPLREACDGMLAKGLHPPAVLFFAMDPAAVDCNVHPAKREVRFRDPALLRSVALMAARSAWGTAAPSASVSSAPSSFQHWKPSPIADQQDLPVADNHLSARVAEEPSLSENSEFGIQDSRPVISQSPAANANFDGTLLPQSGAAPAGLPSAIPGHGDDRDSLRFSEACKVPLAGASAAIFRDSSQSLGSTARFVGQLGGRYLLFEDQESLLLVEIRAARERLLYERFLARLHTGELESQHLLLPEVLEMSPADLAWIEAHKELLHAAGLIAEAFGSKSLKVDAIPADLAQLPVAEIAVRLIDDLRTRGEAPSSSSINREALASSVSRLAAAGAKLPAGESAAQMLLRELLSCDLPYVTPRGRPTMSQMSPGELARRFTA